MQTRTVLGRRLAFARRGEGPPLVFLHNGGTSHAIWVPLMERLAGSHDCIALDLLGYGASEHPAAPVTLPEHVASARELLRQLGVERPVLVGNCMGSALSLRWAAEHPGEVSALVLVNPLTRRTLEAGRLGPFLRFRRSLPRTAGLVYGLLGRLRLPRWSARPVLSTQLGSSGRRQGLSGHAPLVACHASQGQLASLLSVLEDMESYERLDSLPRSEHQPPTLLLWGEENQVLPAEATSRLVGTLAPEASGGVAGGGHLVMLEEPDEVARRIRAFLATLPGVGGRAA